MLFGIRLRSIQNIQYCLVVKKIFAEHFFFTEHFFGRTLSSFKTFESRGNKDELAKSIFKLWFIATKSGGTIFLQNLQKKVIWSVV